MAKKKASLGCLFWLALVLLVVVIFLFNQKTIEEVLKKTGFMNLLTKNQEPMDVTIQPDSRNETHPEGNKPPSNEPPKEIVIDMNNNKPVQSKDNTPPKQGIPDENKPNIRKARLYFVSVNGDGTIALKSIIRSVQYVNSPLRETLQILLQGPISSEINRGLLNIIPEGTKLRNVYVKEKTAFLDFSDEFQFNSLGQVGLQAQLKQVVYTATEFSNINNVQILIEGKVHSHLSPEGLYIREPLSRDSFKN